MAGTSRIMFWRWVIVIGAMMAAIIGVRLLYPERSSVRQEGITGHPAETNAAVQELRIELAGVKEELVGQRAMMTKMYRPKRS